MLELFFSDYFGQKGNICFFHKQPFNLGFDFFFFFWQGGRGGGGVSFFKTLSKIYTTVHLGPVVQKLINANPWVNWGFHLTHLKWILKTNFKLPHIKDKSKSKLRDKNLWQNL